MDTGLEDSDYRYACFDEGILCMLEVRMLTLSDVTTQCLVTARKLTTCIDAGDSCTG